MAAWLFAAFPATAGAVTEYALVIGGTRVTSDNMENVLGDGVFSFDGDKTLTIDGSCEFPVTATSTAGIYNEIDGLIIKTDSESSLMRFGSGLNCIVSTGSVTFTGSGSLTVTGGSYGIFLEDGDMTADHTSLTIRCDEGAHGIYMNKGNFIAKTAHIIAEGGAQAIFAKGGRELVGCGYTKINGDVKYVNYLIDEEVINNAASVEIMPMVSSVSVTATPPFDSRAASFSAEVKDEGCHIAENYRINGVGWYDRTEDRRLAKGDVFEAGHEYTVTVYVDTDEGYSFPIWDQGDDRWPVITAMLNGKSIEKVSFAYNTDIASTGIGYLPAIYKTDVAAISYTFGAVAEVGGVCGDDLSWRIKGDTLTISGSGEMYDWDSINKVPWNSYMDGVNKVIIDNGVTSIGNCAFMTSVNKTGITDVSIPATLKRIGDNAFSNNGLLAPPVLPKGLEFIGNGAFMRCYDFDSVTIPEGVTEISHQAFSECTGLTAISFPSTLKTIGNYVFYSCDALADVYYNGTEDEWNTVSIDDHNDKLKLDWCKATFHFREKHQSGRLPSKPGGKSLSWAVTIPQGSEEGAAMVTVAGDVSREEPLIAASYSEDGALVGVTMVTGTELEGKLDTAGSDRIKLMWWNISGIKPVSDCEDIGL